MEATINGFLLQFQTSSSVFSPTQIDKGTLAMLSHVHFANHTKILDLGCGYGVVGILAAKSNGLANVFMLDIDQEAVALAKQNAIANEVPHVHVLQSDALANLNESGFDLILCNPPYHADFKVPKTFIEKGFNRLVLNGKMLMVTKRRSWYKNKLRAIFGGVTIWEQDGYFVFEAQKRKMKYSQ